jgi:hypothetical protein
MTQPAAGDPAYVSTAIGIWRASAGKPIGRIVASGTTALADNTQVAVPFSAADVIDTHGQHDPTTNNTRVTPNVEGYYRFDGTAFIDGLSTGVSFDASFRLNGSTNLAPGGRQIGSAQVTSVSTTVIQSMNGSTDHVELMARQDSAGADATAQSVQFSSVIQWEFLRPL